NAQHTAGYRVDYRGSVSWRLGDYENARRDLTEAITIAQPAGKEPYKDLLADATSAAAALVLSERKLNEAVTQAQKSLEIATPNFKVAAVRAKSTLGLALALSGQAAAGRKRCEEAVQSARAIRNALPLSEALLAL